MVFCFLFVININVATAQQPLLQFKKVKHRGIVVKIKDQHTFKDGVCYIKKGGSDDGKVFFHRDMDHLALAKNDIANATQIVANTTHVFVLNDAGKLFQYTSNTTKWATNGTWAEVAKGTSFARFNSNFNSMSVGSDGDIYLTKSRANKKYWRLNGGRLTAISIDVANPKKLVYIGSGSKKGYWVLNTQNKLIYVNARDFGTNTTNLKLKDIRLGLGGKLLGIEDNALYPLREVVSTSRLGFVQNAVVGLLNANVVSLATVKEIRDLGGYYFEGKTQAYATLKTNELGQLYLKGKMVNNTNREYEIRLLSIDAKNKQVDVQLYASVKKFARNQRTTPANGAIVSQLVVSARQKKFYQENEQQIIKLYVNKLEKAFLNRRDSDINCATIEITIAGVAMRTKFCGLAKLKVGHSKNHTKDGLGLKTMFNIKRIK